MDIANQFNLIKASIPPDVKIVVVSKTQPTELIQDIYQKTGHLIFGENKAQELFRKHEILPQELQWNFIGHLQTNKVKMLVPCVSMIQSVDSYRLLIEIDKEASKINRIIPCLLQFHIAKEEAKYGFSIDEAKKMLDTFNSGKLANITINGVMGMATFTKDASQVRSEFRTLKSYYQTIKSQYFSNSENFNEISMGMSDDYQIAIEEGSTLIRIGSLIFGKR
jgi:pyridoxal phosphate enzyme (YggS family)